MVINKAGFKYYCCLEAILSHRMDKIPLFPPRVQNWVYIPASPLRAGSNWTWTSFGVNAPSKVGLHFKVNYCVISPFLPHIISHEGIDKVQ